MKVLIVIPVYNEEKIIRNNLLKLSSFFGEHLVGYEYRLVIADNCSTDNTAEFIKELAVQNDKIQYFSIGQKGKGAAIIKAWQTFQNDFDIFCFMDADLATDLRSFSSLIRVIEEGFDLALGSRYLPESKVKRSVLRKIFSFFYSLLARILLKTKIKDLPCGFKAVNQKVVKEILPLIKNLQFFFDSEMVYIAEKLRYKIKEVPVIWVESPEEGRKSKVNLWHVSISYLKELLRLRKEK